MTMMATTEPRYLPLENHTLLYMVAMMAVVAWVFHRQGMGMRREFLLGAVRAFAQLLAVGAILHLLFDIDRWWISVAVVFFMFAAAVVIVLRRERGCKIEQLYRWSSLAMASAVVSVVLPVWVLVIRISPWWKPQYFIMINSMIIAFCMNGVAQTLERFLSDLRANKSKVELALSLGASPRQAIHELLRSALRAQMIPAFHMLVAVGIVQLPGVMTGQIIGGVAPADAVKYQLVILFMMVMARALSGLFFLLMVYPQFFTPLLQLRHDRL